MMSTHRGTGRSGPPTWLIGVVILLGIGLRLAYVHRPFDHRLVNSWRQADYLQIARNFHGEEACILYPRIDWRGDGPGFTEMEFPLVPWVGARLFDVFGPRVQILRGLTAMFEIAALLLFWRLAIRLRNPWARVFALACFSFNPLLLLSSGSLQPDGAMHAFSLAAVVLAFRWFEQPRDRTLLAAGALVGLAILAKLPALYLGLLLAYVVLRRLGTRSFTSLAVWGAAVVAVVPAAAWYSWSHRFWVLYGNSLGVSNESHALGLDMLFPPVFLLGILKWELLAVFSPAGLVLAAAALRRPRAVELSLAWYASAFVFYVATARTTADDWSFYYHTISVAPACLLMGSGLGWFLGLAPGSWRSRAKWLRVVGGSTAVVCLVSLLGYAGLRIRERDGYPHGEVLYRCVNEFLDRVPRDGRIVVRGGQTTDEYGLPVAHNESMAFAWMDRRGFNYGDDELSLDTLDDIAGRGGRYWIVGREELIATGLESRLPSRYRLLARCSRGGVEYLLYDLLPDPRQPSALKSPAPPDPPLE